MDGLTEGLLWHYTSLEAFKNIIEKPALQATNIRHMNDAGEFKASREQLLGILGEDSADTPEQQVRRLLRDWATIAFPPEIYVSCFSSAVDQLSQWRAYCRPAPGVAIGFNAALLLDAARKEGFDLVRCEYAKKSHSRDTVRAALQQVMEARQQDLAAVASADSDTRQAVVLDVARAAWSAFQMLAVTHKHPGFTEEQEFRLVSSPSPTLEPRAQLRTRNGVLVPYVSIPFPVDKANFPISRVWIGPTTDSEMRHLILHSLYILVFTSGLEPIDFRFSETPLRTY